MVRISINIPATVKTPIPDNKSMVFVINSAALILCWLGILMVYLASERQAVLSRPLAKPLGWFLFSLSLPGAFLLLLNLHNWLAAVLILLVMIMLVWIALALIAPYFPQQRWLLIHGTVLTTITALIGGFYVV
ncbi:hypothetical protein [Planctobacterium marinum]|uniref:hypothetical protein n=1 Tax=Planctobacterium marinum TaxID=1631968 RepID=UPI001E53FD03|nr:hypothetical protein [Planctobacterium marinum]MCC2607461.1 hypothetical protein [Planctobacterium marinum]